MNENGLELILKNVPHYPDGFENEKNECQYDEIYQALRITEQGYEQLQIEGKIVDYELDQRRKEILRLKMHWIDLCSESLFSSAVSDNHREKENIPQYYQDMISDMKTVGDLLMRMYPREFAIIKTKTKPTLDEPKKYF